MLEALRTGNIPERTARPKAGRAAAAGSLAIIQNAPNDQPFVVAQLGQSLDGRIATISGDSRWISGDAALDHVHALRAHVDAVVVGVGTAICDDPQLTVRRVAGRQPTRVVVDPNARLPDCAKCLRDDGARRIIVRGAGARASKDAETIFLPRGERGLCPIAIVGSLFEKGMTRILIEGGARTISAFIDADAVDRLHILMAPVLIGSGKPGLELKPIDRLSAARRPHTTPHLLPGGEVLFDCDMRNCTAPK